MPRALAVFCGSASGRSPAYAAAARRVGRLLAEKEITLVYGGGRVGMMGALADAALEAGGRVVGVIPRALVEREAAHRGVTELRVVETMHERKALLSDLSAATLTLPGGIGTYEEFFEVLTWSHLGLQRKLSGVLDVEGYYAPLRALIDHAVAEEFLKESHRDLLRIDDDPERLLGELGF